MKKDKIYPNHKVNIPLIPKIIEDLNEFKLNLFKIIFKDSQNYKGFEKKFSYFCNYLKKEEFLTFDELKIKNLYNGFIENYYEFNIISLLSLNYSVYLNNSSEAPDCYIIHNGKKYHFEITTGNIDKKNNQIKKFRMKNIIKDDEEVFIISNTKANYTFDEKIKNIYVPILNSENKNPLYYSLKRKQIRNIYAIAKSDFENKYGIYFNYKVINNSYITLTIKDILYSKINKIFKIKKNIINNPKMNTIEYFEFIESLNFEDLFSNDINKITKFINNNKDYISNNFFENFRPLIKLLNTNNNLKFSLKINNFIILLDNLNLFLSESDLSKFSKLNNPNYLLFLLERMVYQSTFLKKLDFLGNRNDLKKFNLILFNLNNGIFDCLDCLPYYIHFYIIFKFEEYLNTCNYDPLIDVEFFWKRGKFIVDFKKFYNEMKIYKLFNNLNIIKKKDCKDTILFIINFINNKFAYSKDYLLAQDFCFETGSVSYF